MIYLLIVILLLVLINLSISVGLAVLVVKQSERLGELWDDIQEQRLSIRRLINWAGGVVGTEEK